MYNVRCGIPQGSVFGPMLCSIYLCLSYRRNKACEVFMYADGTVLLPVFQDFDIAESQSQDGYNRLIKCSRNPKSVVNTKKKPKKHTHTFIVCFHSQHKPIKRDPVVV